MPIEAPKLDVIIHMRHGQRVHRIVPINDENVWIVTHEALDAVKTRLVENFLGPAQPPILLFSTPPFMTIEAVPITSLRKSDDWISIRGPAVVTIETSRAVKNPLIRSMTITFP